MVNSQTPSDNIQDDKLESKAKDASKNIIRLKALEIVGFKSFAQKTKLKFDSATTAVVGPNGCGKSNLLDAIKWVLGEKSSKSIRGEKMEDVIFSGTQNQKAANFAQVTLLLDNSNRKFFLDSDEVSISRRLYRDNQSQYLINGRQVSRKEVEHMLLDTGLGKASYSFMEQGRMDQILSSKPEERRVIFEEAAGINRYKAQKEAALKNLDATQLNMTRIEDILHELTREYDLKKNQAGRTDTYNQLAKKKRNHHLRMSYFTLNKTIQNIELLTSQLQSKNIDREKIRQKLLQMDEQIIALENEKQKQQKELHQKDISNQIAREKIQQWKNTSQKNEEHKKQIRLSMDQIQDQLTKFKKCIEELKLEQDQQSQLTFQLDTQIEDSEKNLETIKNQQKNILSKIDQTETEIKSIIEKEKNNKNELACTREEQSKLIQSLLIELQKETKSWPEEIKQRKNIGREILHKIKIALEEGKERTNNLLKDLEENIDYLIELPSGLRQLLLEKGGVYARKTDTDQLIAEQEKSLIVLDKKRQDSFFYLENLREENIITNQKVQTLIADIKQYHLQKNNLQEKENSIQERIATEEGNLKYFQNQFDKSETDLISLEQSQKQYYKEINSLQAGIKKELSSIDSIEAQLEKLELKRKNFQETIRKENSRLNSLLQTTNELEVKIATLKNNQEVLIQNIYNDYNLNFDQLKEHFSQSRIRIEVEQDKINEIEKEIQKLGLINPLAIEELSAIEKLVEHNQTQLNDIKEARSDIHKVIDEINKKSEKTFHSTFKKIEENFCNLFSNLFQGGSAKLTLLEPENILTTGIDISVQPPGKRPRSLRLLSGGEKTLTAIALMFAIYMVRSSPFCVLDEIDAPLDDHNVVRFLNMLNNFTEETQFILITHHKKTMSHCNTMFGITMEEPGISKVLGVEISSLPASR